MTCYKLVTIKCKWFPLTSVVEPQICSSQQRIFTNFHRQVFCWTDDWYGKIFKKEPQTFTGDQSYCFMKQNCHFLMDSGIQKYSHAIELQRHSCHTLALSKEVFKFTLAQMPQKLQAIKLCSDFLSKVTLHFDLGSAPLARIK